METNRNRLLFHTSNKAAAEEAMNDRTINLTVDVSANIGGTILSAGGTVALKNEADDSIISTHAFNITAAPGTQSFAITSGLLTETNVYLEFVNTPAALEIVDEGFGDGIPTTTPSYVIDLGAPVVGTIGNIIGFKTTSFTNNSLDAIDVILYLNR